MGLAASQNPYFVADTNPPLKVTWDRSDDPVELWERFSQNSPSFKKRDLTDSERDNRRMDVSIGKGEVYTVALYSRDSDHPDPNENLTDPPPNDLLAVVGIVDQYRDMIRLPDGIGNGGTFIDVSMATTDICYVLMQVGTTTPVVIPMPTKSDVELKRLIAPDVEERSFGGQGHELECKPLNPGDLYSVVIMAVAEDGAWDCYVDALNTKLRQVDITINRIRIKNDGDPGSNGEGEFWVSVCEAGTAVESKILKTFNIGGDKFMIHDNMTIDLDWRYRIGPKKIDPAVDGIVFVHTNGLEYDGIEGTEKAASDGTDIPFQFPSGRGLEDTEETDVIVTANAQDGDDFTYNAKFDWKVKYV